MKRLVHSVLLLALAGAVGIGLPWAVAQVANENEPQADGPPQREPQATQPQAEQEGTVNYLGVLVTEVPEILSVHFPDTLADGRGVMVMEVTPDSPAAEAGLEPFDVLLAVGGEQLAGPEQLVTAVRDAEAGAQITLQVLHGGETGEMAVTLGRRPARAVAPGPPRGPRFDPRFGPRFGPRFPEFRGPRGWVFGPEIEIRPGFGDGAVQGLSLRSLGDGRYQAEVFYHEPGGQEPQRRSFEGTLEEIREQMREELPESVSEPMIDQLDAQQQLLESGGGFGAFGDDFGFGAPPDPNEMFERFFEGLPPEIRERFEQPFRMPRPEREQPREDLPVA